MENSNQPDTLYSFRQYIQEHDLEADIPEGGRRIELVCRSGRGQHRLGILQEIAQKYVDIDFAQYKYFHKHYGIFSYSKGYFEVEIDVTGENIRSPSSIFRRMTRLFRDGTTESGFIRFGEHSENNYLVTIDLASDEFRLMIGADMDYDRTRGISYSRRVLHDFLEDPERKEQTLFGRVFPITFKAENIKIQTFSETKKILEDLSNSCFFSLSREFNIDFELVIVPQRQIRRQHIEPPPQVLTAPSNRYPPEAMSFYRYGLSARNMPLLQFLAFYQVVEFFFEDYSMREIQELAVNHLKDPRFSPYKSDLVKDLIYKIKSHRASDTTRNEREQLATVLRSTLNVQEMLNWIEGDEDRSNFFKTRDPSNIPLNLRNSENLISQIAERVYDIRCRIVHSKASGTERDFILPYSEETIHLSHDIDLMREIAERVLIASSSELRVQTMQ